MKKYECEICGYIYDPAKGDPDSGIAPGTHHLKTFPMIGFVQYVVQTKQNLVF